MDKLLFLLENPSIPNIRKLAKIIRRHNIIGYEEYLLKYLCNIIGKDKYWETQMEIIKTLGQLHYKPLLPIVENIINVNKKQDTVTFFATIAYIRIFRKTLTDGEIIYELLTKGSDSIIGGITDTLFIDKMIPSEEYQDKIIALCSTFGMDPLSKYGNDRLLGLIAIFPLWTSSKIPLFLENFTSLSPLTMNIVQDSLAGRFNEKLRFERSK